ncbi:MAG: efflux RND transporter periplasmic adaptor subunit, partial [Verrucomicrobiae bacterium]|nr:efflux RND transporter periplasmic adaptor subunit [Verrucomicrobiae bacterium]
MSLLPAPRRFPISSSGLTALGAAAVVFLLASCGKPPGPQAPPGGMAMPVIAAKVQRKPLEENLPLVGSLQPKEDIRVLSETDARIESIDFTPGHIVEPGAMLFTLDSRRQRAMLAEGEAKLALAQSELKRGEELLASNTIPEQEIERLRASALAAEAQVKLLQAELEDTTIKAPFRGAVSDRQVSVGQFVRRGEELALLLQTDPLELVFQVPERFVGQIRMGQKIQFSIVAFPGETFEGEVGYISPKLDDTSRTLLVKVYLKNPESRLRSGMFGSVELKYRAKEDALIIPQSAILFDADRVYVVGVDAENKATFRPVKTGLQLAGQVEILDGLAEGDIVVVEGYQKLGPGSPVVFSPDSEKYGVAPTSPPAQAPPSEEAPP